MSGNLNTVFMRDLVSVFPTTFVGSVHDYLNLTEYRMIEWPKETGSRWNSVYLRRNML